jgi:phage terminase small subunit
MSGSANLTPRQAAFIPEFLASGNATASAIKAGFSVKGASVAGTRMLRNASVQRALQARQASDATRLSIQREDVLNGLLEAVNMAREQRNPMGMVRGCAELGKMLGYYAVETKRLEVNVEGQNRMNHLDRLSDAELLKIIEAGQGLSA